ncbi:MAG: [protein-PII] uridylyltransferase [Lysobacterales bacterium]
MTADQAPVSLLPPLPRLPAALPRSGVSSEARHALKQLLEDDARGLVRAFDGGTAAATLVRARATSVGRVVAHVWEALVGKPDAVALFATGGFGRGVLFPYSDVDLLVFGSADALHTCDRALAAFAACLWDIGLKPGFARRDPGECRAMAMADQSVFTSLLDARRVAGSESVEAGIAAIVLAPDLWPPAAFLAAKRTEDSARRARHGDSSHNLEPDLKDGPGGLRTLDTLRWLGRRIAGAGTFEAMAAQALIEGSEADALAGAEAVLQRSRYALHVVARRPGERLLFDYQRAIAARLGFRDDGNANLAVEQFMQQHYRAATMIERIAAQVFERCAEWLDPPDVPRRVLDRDFIAAGPRLELRAPDLFQRRPQAMVSVFGTLVDHPELRDLAADTMRRLQHALAESGGGFAADPFVRAALLALLRRGAPAAAALTAMNRHGVLAALIPAFQRVVGRMQYDLFHVYTVDEHTLRVLRNLARFAESSATGEYPLAATAWRQVEKPELLLLAGLFHDIAKGRGGDHSELGEAEVRTFCAVLGLSGDEVELVAWLVRWHLLMSVTAQRQDITDPAIVHRFASHVGDCERLDHLYLLTVADIAGTNPKLWNAWKASLLADLYVATRYALRAGLESPPHVSERMASCRDAAATILVSQGMARADAAGVLDAFPGATFLRHRPESIAWQARALAGHRGNGPVVAVEPRSNRGVTELFVSTADRDGLFAAIAAVLDRLRFSVVEARVLTAPDQRAFDSFVLLDADTQEPVGDARAAALRHELEAVLSAPRLEARLVRHNLPRRLRHFQRPPGIEFRDEGAATQLAFVYANQPGLLARLAQALREARVRVRDARIATFGDRAEDFFLLTDENDRPLDERARESVRAALRRQFDDAGEKLRAGT